MANGPEWGGGQFLCLEIYMTFLYFCFSVKNVVGLGEGAGANILARFAVSILSQSMTVNKMMHSGTKIFQYCTCPAGRVTYNSHSSCKHILCSLKEYAIKNIRE